MEPVPEGPPRLPTNSSSSLACSTTSGGCSLHRAGTWELSTLPETTPLRDPSPTAVRRRTGWWGGASSVLRLGWRGDEPGFQKGHLLGGSAQEKLGGEGDVATLWGGKGLCGSPRSAEAGAIEGRSPAEPPGETHLCTSASYPSTWKSASLLSKSSSARRLARAPSANWEGETAWVPAQRHLWAGPGCVCCLGGCSQPRPGTGAGPGLL